MMGFAFHFAVVIFVLIVIIIVLVSAMPAQKNDVSLIYYTCNTLSLCLVIRFSLHLTHVRKQLVPRGLRSVVCDF